MVRPPPASNIIFSPIRNYSFDSTRFQTAVIFFRFLANLNHTGRRKVVILNAKLLGTRTAHFIFSIKTNAISVYKLTLCLIKTTSFRKGILKPQTVERQDIKHNTTGEKLQKKCSFLNENKFQIQ